MGYDQSFNKLPGRDGFPTSLDWVWMNLWKLYFNWKQVTRFTGSYFCFAYGNVEVQRGWGCSACAEGVHGMVTNLSDGVYQSSVWHKIETMSESEFWIPRGSTVLCCDTSLVMWREFPFPFLKAKSHSIIFAVKAKCLCETGWFRIVKCWKFLLGLLPFEWISAVDWKLRQFSEREFLLLCVLSACGRGKDFCAEADSNMRLALLWGG